MAPACRETEELIASLISEYEARRRGEFPPPPAESTAPMVAAPSVVSEVPAAPLADAAPLIVAAPAPAFAFSFTDSTPHVEQPPSAEAAPETHPPAGEGFSLVSESPAPANPQAMVAPKRRAGRAGVAIVGRTARTATGVGLRHRQ